MNPGVLIECLSYSAQSSVRSYIYIISGLCLLQHNKNDFSLVGVRRVHQQCFNFLYVLPWDLTPWKYIFYLHVSSFSFHGSAWELPLLLVEVDYSTNFHHLKLPKRRSVEPAKSLEATKSFHNPLSTSTYFHEFPKLPSTSTRVHRIPLLPPASIDVIASME